MIHDSPCNRLDVDPAVFRRNFEYRPFKLTAHIARPELFSREYLADAAQRLPGNMVEINAGNVARSAPQSGGVANAISISDAILNNEAHNLWVGLKAICALPEYRQVIDELLDSVAPLVNESFPGMSRREGFIFLSSPGAVVPYHMDPEHNFLVHLEGTKCMTIFDKSDRRIVSDEDIERTYTQGHRKLKLDPGLEQYATRFELQPGQALHVPISAPHYVINGDAPCISLSVTFATPRTMRRGRILKVNHHLRKLGISPSPPEQRVARDAFKSALGSVYQGARTLMGGQ